MSHRDTAKEPPAQEQPKAAQDLSADIINSVAREPSDVVRCVRVFGNYYRCNWWAPTAVPMQRHPAYPFAALATHHVRKSSFFNATVNSGKMTLLEVSS